MKQTVLLACLLGLTSLGCLGYVLLAPAQSEVVELPRYARGVHVAETIKNLGLVKLDTTISQTFNIVNDTPDALTLAEPTKSCSCYEATLSQKDLAPGETATLTMVLNTRDRRGPRSETVVVGYSQPNGKTGSLPAHLQFIGQGEFEAEPLMVTITPQQPKATFRIIATAGNDHKILDVKATHPAIKIDKTTLPTITLTVDPNVILEDRANIDCVVYTTHKLENMIRVPVRVVK
jgi:hypothetical protein